MDLVEDDEFDVADQIGSLVKHAPQNFGRHDQTRSLRINLHVSRQDTHAFRREGGLEVAKLLIRESLDGRRVDGSAKNTVK